MRRPILVLGVLASTLAVGSAAAAPPGPALPANPLAAEVGAPISPQPGTHSGFTIDPPGPYEVHVGTVGGAVFLSVIRGERRKRVAATSYVARGTATPERMQATFGKFGRIAMRFRESRHRPWVGKKRDCRGRSRFVVRRGVFVGELQFRGEGGYLTIRSHRAKGSITSLAQKCHHRGHRRGALSSSLFDDSFSGLIASDRNGVDSTAFVAFGFRDRLMYLAEREESRGQLSILRAALVRDRGGLPLNEAITAGKFSPGTPFHGTGRYRAAADGSTSWSGDLSVDFPGAPRFPLAGPAYETFLEAGL